MRISDWSSDVCSSDLLAHVDREAELSRPVLQAPGNVVEGVGAVDFGLSRAEQIEVGPIEDIDGRWFRHGRFLYGGRRGCAKGVTCTTTAPFRSSTEKRSVGKEGGWTCKYRGSGS